MRVITPEIAAPIAIPASIFAPMLNTDEPNDLSAVPALEVKEENLEVDFVTDTTVLSKSAHDCFPLLTAFAESTSSVLTPPIELASLSIFFELIVPKLFWIVLIFFTNEASLSFKLPLNNELMPPSNTELQPFFLS